MHRWSMSLIYSADLQFYMSCTDMFLWGIYMHTYAYIQYMDIGSHNPLGKVISQPHDLLAFNILHKRQKNNSTFWRLQEQFLQAVPWPCYCIRPFSLGQTNIKLTKCLQIKISLFPKWTAIQKPIFNSPVFPYKSDFGSALRHSSVTVLPIFSPWTANCHHVAARCYKGSVNWW